MLFQGLSWKVPELSEMQQYTHTNQANDKHLDTVGLLQHTVKGTTKEHGKQYKIKRDTTNPKT